MRNVLLAAVVFVTQASSAVTPLWSRGYAVIPAPQQVTLRGSEEIVFDASWSVSTSIAADHIALRALTQDLLQFHRLRLVDGQKKTLVLSIQPGTVSKTPEGYRIDIAADRIAITGNADAGLFYGVQTFLQLSLIWPWAHRKHAAMPLFLWYPYQQPECALRHLLQRP